MLTSDGSVISANLPTEDNSYQPTDNRLYRGMIIGIHYTDSQKNLTYNSINPQITYDVVILGGFMEGVILTNCRLSSKYGGCYNYHERVLRKISKQLHEIPLREQDGDIVLIQYIQGDPDFPQITGCGVSPLDKTKTGATEADGPRLVEQYNGIKKTINKDGEYFLHRKGGIYDAKKGYFIPSDESDEYTGEVVLPARLEFRVDKTVLDGGEKIAIGANNIELLQKISEQLAILISLFAVVKSHTHPCSVDSVSHMGTTTGPSTSGDWNDAANSLEDIKTAIDSIKTTLL
jgi:hypothetical protein